MNFKSSLVCAAAAGLFFTGCSMSTFTGYEAENTKKIAALADSAACDFGAYSKYHDKPLTVAQQAVKHIKIDDPIYHGNSLGLKALICERYEKSLDFFRAAQYAREQAGIASAAGKAVVGALVNDNATDYSGVHYELPTAHAYMGLDQLALGDLDEAYRTMQATEYMQNDTLNNLRSELEKEEKKLAGEGKEASGLWAKIVEKMMSEHKDAFDIEDDEIVTDGVDKRMRSAKNFKNTFADYLVAVTYYLHGDVDYANHVMRNMALTLNSPELADEAEFMKRKNHPAQIWTIYENGLGSPLEEFKFTFPFPSVASIQNIAKNPLQGIKTALSEFESSVNTVDFAVSVLGKPKAAHESISINGEETKEISNMDAIIRAEYKAGLKTRLLKSVINTSISLVAQEAANKQGGLLALGATALSVAKNKADVRYFVGLPKNYQATRVANNGSVEIKAGEKVIYKQNVNANEDLIVYVKSVPNEAGEIVDIVQIIGKNGLIARQ